MKKFSLLNYYIVSYSQKVDFPFFFDDFEYFIQKVLFKFTFWEQPFSLESEIKTKTYLKIKFLK